jgi:MprA protease rhombosortase-interaction domain-containing protein
MAHAGIVFNLADGSGLSGEVEFTLINPTTLEIRARNTSTGVPMGFDESDQLLTGVSFDMGAPGNIAGDPVITGGSAMTGPSSATLNFDNIGVQLGANSDVSGEYGFGNSMVSGNLANFVSGNSAGAIAFSGANLDGSANLNGPQGGLVASPALVALNGLGAIQNEIIATITISQPLANLDFLSANSVQIEFGSDAAFIRTPEPGTAMLLALAGTLAYKRRRSE